MKLEEERNEFQHDSEFQPRAFRALVVACISSFNVQLADSVLYRLHPLRGASLLIESIEEVVMKVRRVLSEAIVF